jgi:phosphate transport system substrate-binding protein
MKIVMNIGISLFLLLMASCADRDNRGNILDTPTAGSINITADESLKPLIDAEISAFEGIYRNAQVNVVYTNEGHAIERLLADSARLTIVTRPLVAHEENELQKQTIVPTQLKIARDGIALICNRMFPDSLLNTEDVKRLLSAVKEKSLPKTKHLPVGFVVVFDQPNSGIVRYMMDSLRLSNSLPKYCFAVHGNAAVVDYVSKNPQAIGLIDVGWISDRDDSTSNSFLNSIRVMSIARDTSFYQPYQAYLAQGKYPFLRDITMISREARSGLASGFMAFVASDKGQRIVLKSGLVPATMPIRIVEVNHEPF